MPGATWLLQGVQGLQMPANHSCCWASQVEGAGGWTLHSLAEHRVSMNQPRTAKLQPLSSTILQPLDTCLGPGGPILFLFQSFPPMLPSAGLLASWLHLSSEGPNLFWSSGSAQLGGNPGRGSAAEQALEK